MTPKFQTAAQMRRRRKNSCARGSVRIQDGVTKSHLIETTFAAMPDRRISRRVNHPNDKRTRRSGDFSGGNS